MFAGVLRGPRPEEVDLREVEVRFDPVARVAFVHWGGGGAEVQAVVLGADLQEGAFRGDGREGQGGEEVGQQREVLRRHRVGVGPEAGARERWGLHVGGEVDVVGVDVVILEDLRDLLGGAVEKVDGEGDDVLVVWVLGRTARERVDLVPTGRVLGEDFQHCCAGDAICAGDDDGVSLVVVVGEGWEAVEDAF